MNPEQLWNKLELDNDVLIDTITELENGMDVYRELRQRVIGRLNDGVSYDTATKIFHQEYNNPA